MEIVFFIVFVLVCALGLMWAAGRSKKEDPNVALKRKAKAKENRADLLTTPSNYLLSNRGDVWQKKRQNAAEDVIVTNRFVPKSVSAGEPEYDGFSRRDRHHVVVGTAHIKKEDHVDKPAMTSIDYDKGQAAS